MELIIKFIGLEIQDIYFFRGKTYDKVASDGSELTNYPKEISTPVLEQIKNKIKDIKYCQVYQTVASTLILTIDGEVYSASSIRKCVGDGKTTSINDWVKISLPGKAKAISCEDGLSLVILENGDVYGWGVNTYGIMGPQYTIGETYSTPQKLNLSNIKYMTVGEGFAIFVSKAGVVYGIGKNDYGQLGTGDSEGKTDFVRCEALEK